MNLSQGSTQSRILAVPLGKLFFRVTLINTGSSAAKMVLAAERERVTSVLGTKSVPPLFPGEGRKRLPAATPDKRNSAPIAGKVVWRFIVTFDSEDDKLNVERGGQPKPLQ